MHSQAKFEAPQEKLNNGSLTRDDVSSNLFSSVMSDLNNTPGDSTGTSLIQNDIPKAFRGSADFEIVNEVGSSMTKLSSNRPARTDSDLPEAPSSGRPKNACPEKVGESNKHRPHDTTDEAPSTGRPPGASAEGYKGSHPNRTQRTVDDTKKTYASDEARSAGQPIGASAEAQLKGFATGNKHSSTDNIKKQHSKDEVDSIRKPLGAKPESELQTKKQDRRSSTADPAQQNRGVEIEGRRRNERGVEEKRNTTTYDYGYL